MKVPNITVLIGRLLLRVIAVGMIKEWPRALIDRYREECKELFDEGLGDTRDEPFVLQVTECHGLNFDSLTKLPPMVVATAVVTYTGPDMEFSAVQPQYNSPYGSVVTSCKGTL